MTSATTVEVELTGTTLVVINVYFPANGYDEEYNKCLSSLEDILSSYHSFPIIVAGDFNAHLGLLGGPRGSGTPNQQGVHLKQLIDRHELFVASLKSDAAGPTYTYHSGSHATTVDYILSTLAAANISGHVQTMEDHPLNTSDQLPLTIKLNIAPTLVQDFYPTKKSRLGPCRARWSTP